MTRARAAAANSPTVTDHKIDPLDAYRDARRAQAAKNPRPLRRTGRRWLPFDLSHYVTVAADAQGRLEVDGPTGGVTSLAKLIVTIVETGSPVGILFADRDSVTATRRRLRRESTSNRDPEASREAGQALRSLAIAETLPVNPITPVLTDLMAANLWLPVDVPERLSLLDGTTDHPWQQTLALWGLYEPAAGPMFDQLVRPNHTHLMEAVAAGDPRVNDLTITRVFNEVATSARMAAGFGRYTSDKAAMAAFRSATQATDQGNFLLAIDPVAIEESLLAGRIAQMDVLSQADGREVVAAITDGVLRASERSDLFVFSHGFATKATLQGFEPDGDVMVAKLTLSRKGYIGLLPDQVFAVAEPLRIVPVSPGERWLSRKGSTRAVTRQREIPLPVLLAGAPE